MEIERLSRVAWKRSLILPGWGQYTNGGVWWIKVPVIYGGFVASVLVFDYWQWYYKMFLGELQHQKEHGQGSEGILGINSNWTVQGLVQQKDYGRRNRDLTIVLTLGWYGLNVVEAYVDSILKNRWNVSNDLSMKVSPTFLPNYAYTLRNGRFFCERIGYSRTKADFYPQINSEPIMKIVLLGYGKMGQLIERFAIKRGHEVLLIVEEDNRERISSADLQDADMAIDFSTPDAALANINLCFESRLPLVVGTTGWYDRLDEIKEICNRQEQSLLYGSNFSIGVNVFFHINRLLATALNPYKQYDVQVEEIHHIHKLDAPSGTAITIAEGIVRTD